MPTKIIYFDHNGRTTDAELYYDFQDYEDVILVIPKGKIEDLYEIIPFVRKNKKWEPVSPAKNKFPSTIQSIINQLNDEHL
jgi:hypothetical protein